jgi:hypothetical protein
MQKDVLREVPSWHYALGDRKPCCALVSLAMFDDNSGGPLPEVLVAIA